MTNKKTPLRMCTGCREMKPKAELIRIVKTPEGKILLDITGKTVGRGAYICKHIQCLEKAEKTSALSRCFGMPVDREVYTSLREAVGKLER